MERVGASSSASAAAVSPAKKLEKACREFEGFFLAEMLKKNMAAASGSGEKEEGEAFGPLEETSMEMVGQSLSSYGEGMGLWKVLYRDLSRNLPDGASGEELSQELTEERHS